MVIVNTINNASLRNADIAKNKKVHVYILGSLISRIMNIGPIQRQSIISLASFGGVTIIGYMATIYFTHFLGPAILGSFYLFTAYFGVFDLISCGGFGGAAIKRISEGKDQNEFYTASVILRFVLLAVSILIFILLSPWLAGISSPDLFYLFIITLIVGAINGACAIDVLSTARIGISQTSNMLNTLIKILIQVILVFIGWSLGGLIVGFIIGMIASALFNYHFIHLKITKCKFSHFKDLSTFAFWTFLSSSGGLVSSYADTILIGFFLSVDEVGIYRIAFQLAGVSAITVTALNSVLFPRISRWHTEQNLPMIRFVVSKAITYCLLLAIPITIGGMLLSNQLMYFLYGESFESGSSCLIILLFAEIANIFMYLFTMCLNSVNKPRESFIVMIISAILNVVLNILLIPIIGINGAATAIFVTMTINALLAYAFLRQEVRIQLEMKQIGYITLSSLVMAGSVLVFIYFFGVETFAGLCIAISLGALVYFSILLKIDGAFQTDLRNIIKELTVQ